MTTIEIARDRLFDLLGQPQATTDMILRWDCFGFWRIRDEFSRVVSESALRDLPGTLEMLGPFSEVTIFTECTAQEIAPARVEWTCCAKHLSLALAEQSG